MKRPHQRCHATERWVNLALLLGSSALALLAFAGFDLALSRHQGGDPLATEPLRTNGRSLYINKPNGWYELNTLFSGEDRYGPHRYPVATDAKGFRIPTTPPQLPITGSDRKLPALLFLGDSFTYGVASRWEESFVGQVARQYPGPVINAGVNSHSPTPHRFRLQRLFATGGVPAGAVVIMAIDISDVFDEASRWQPGSAEPSDRSSQVAAPAATRQVIERQNRRQQEADAAPFFSPRNFQLTHRIYYGLEALYKRFFDHWQVRNNHRSAFTHRPWEELDAAYGPLGVAGGLRQLRQQIQAAARLSASHGHRFLLLIYPWPAQLAYSSAFNWERWISESCQAPDCSGVINAFPAFRAQVAPDPSAAAWQERLYLRGDMHFSAEGNAVVARTILNTLHSQ